MTAKIPSLSRYQSRLRSLLWSARYAHLFIRSKSLRRELDELSRRTQFALGQLDLGTRPWVVPSAIAPSESFLSYSNVRSVFKPSERINQTKQTLKSIEQLGPNQVVLLIDSTMNRKQIEDLLVIGPNISALDISDLRLITLACEGPFKGLGETLVVLGVSGAPQLQNTGFWKISGRYQLVSDSLPKRDGIPKGVTALIKNAHMSTTCYSVAPESVTTFRFALEGIIRQLLMGVAIERALYRRLESYPDLHSVSRLGVSGLIAVNGEKFSM